jgi:hypothetical protein
MIAVRYRYGGIAAVARATGIAPSTIGRGLAELDDPVPLSADRVRRPGGGRHTVVSKDPQLLADLDGLVAPGARGDPMSPLRWTTKSLRRLAAELRKLGHRISHTVVGELLHGMKFSLQGNRKTRDGDSHPDRDAQFAYLAGAVSAALEQEQPAISVDAKKKELVGDFKNPGREWRPCGDPEEVRIHDFLVEELGRAIPYGVYDLAANEGWVNVGVDHDTACFAVHSIRRWWQEIGRARYPQAHRLIITADCGGSPFDKLRRRAPAPVEERAAEAGQRTGLGDRSASPAARHQQVESDRASPVLVHLDELARPAADQLSCHHRPDQRDPNQDRPDRALRTRPCALSQGHHRVRHGICGHQYHACGFPWRLELYHSSTTPRYCS